METVYVEMHKEVAYVYFANYISIVYYDKSTGEIKYERLKSNIFNNNGWENNKIVYQTIIDNDFKKFDGVGAIDSASEYMKKEFKRLN